MSKKPVILFRNALEQEEEFNAAKDIWGDDFYEFRSEIPEDSLVIARYSALPFYKELEKELARKGSSLINSHAAHRYISGMEWIYDLDDLTPQTWSLTPQTWSNWANLPNNCSFVLKGRTNSRKFKWNTHMFAKTKEDVPIVASRLLDDSLIGDQGIVVRKYEPLKKLGEGINGLPITNEWRFFLLDGEIISQGFYWSILEDSPKEPSEDATFIVQRAAQRLNESGVRFVVIDVAEKEDGTWTIIELNDGQMSGLSENDSVVLYSKLKERL